MEKSPIKNDNFAFLRLLIAIFSLSGCGQFGQMSEIISKDGAGINGSFEVSKSGIPVNWYFYTPKTVPEGDFDIVTDTIEFRDGKQSLKFTVRSCKEFGGWYSPGFFQEFPVEPGKTYRVSYWLKNQRCKYQASLKGMDSSLKSNKDFLPVSERSEPENGWQKFESRYTLSVNHNRLRFEFNILGPGVLWIDDFRIEKE